MIETIIYEYLNEELEVPAYMEVPADAPDEFVIIEKLGSREIDKIQRATFALRSYAKSMYRAASVNESVKEAMDNLISLDEVSASQLESDYNFTNTITHQYRYQAVYDVYYMLGG